MTAARRVEQNCARPAHGFTHAAKRAKAGQAAALQLAHNRPVGAFAQRLAAVLLGEHSERGGVALVPRGAR
jgi:hypothetical protein